MKEEILISNTVINHGGKALSEAVEKAYQQGFSDYYIEPLVAIDKEIPIGKIQSGDSVVFCCRRGEREIELTELFTEKDFSKVEYQKLDDLYFVILTLYHEKFAKLPVAFAPEHVQLPLAQVLAENGKTQFHCAESEKYAHVTFFLNGGNNNPFEKETDCQIPSVKGIPFDEKPELSLAEVSQKVQEALGNYDFVVTNFANGDVIGHTSNSEAKITACTKVDEHLKEVVTDALEKDYVVIITADHGNIETLRNADGSAHVAHTDNHVGCILLDGRNNNDIVLRDGSLCDIAPTVLHIMNIEKPDIMTGKTLTDHNFGIDRKVLLVILDGWGIGSKDSNDAVYLADTSYWDSLMKKSHCYLKAHGSYVGLAEGKPGNSEAGHLNIGAGRIVDQDDIRLDKAISNGTYSQNEKFIEAVKRAKENNKALHLIAYLTYKSSHGSINYAIEIARLAKEMGLEKVYFHIIFDGRSTDPGSAPQLIMKLDEVLSEIGVGVIVDGVGRGIALDRDHDYEKVKKAYDGMVEGKGTQYQI